ncbi:MAG: serine hydrolase, partial [Crocinitomicaceae bacterium]|nr:serine hydrolase [Crocinitomicaceae bacterium]
MKRMRLFSSLLVVSLLGFALTRFYSDQKTTENKSKFKYELPTKWIGSAFSDLNTQQQTQQIQGFRKHIEILKNNQQVLPLGRLDQKLACMALGGNSSVFTETLNLYADRMAFFAADSLQIPAAVSKFYGLTDPDICIFSLHAAAPHSNHIDKWAAEKIALLDSTDQNILVVFGEHKILKEIDTSVFAAIVIAHENHPIAQAQIAQLLMGGLSAAGIEANGRLGISSPEELGLKTSDLKGIDDIAQKGIDAGAYPGCQVLVAVEDKIIWHKAYGKQGYQANAPEIDLQSMYDIASVTKIAASTLLAMELHAKGKFNLDQTLGSYIPDVVGSSPFAALKIREIMAHQAGLTPWIPFYKRTLSDGTWKSNIYQSSRSDDFALEVAKGMYIHKNYKDSMYAQILRSELGPKKYVYSDLCYYFTQPILERIIGESQASYLRRNIYLPLGLGRILYQPLRQFSEQQIVPTEYDQAFRKQLLRGYVHDPGAAMLGGIAGHAGIFSNAWSLANVMQLFLNKGEMAGQRFFSEATYTEFTKQQYPGNRRAAGFDRPTASGGGTCDVLASQQSFGHSGFTGTLAWADPKSKVIFIFLSNRVHPNQDNWKLRDLNIRTDMHHVVYTALAKRG